MVAGSGGGSRDRLRAGRREDLLVVVVVCGVAMMRGGFVDPDPAAVCAHSAAREDGYTPPAPSPARVAWGSGSASKALTRRAPWRSSGLAYLYVCVCVCVSECVGVCE